ncbi:hypothetical protein [Helicobacter bilis]|uniref:hypothetical protein n=1 Tax=Helicobacter bilis TaxID=37372 RepID=UPI0026F08E8F|nr:hypothetical protein [Helicobacter bilis]MCI7410114.1 hypothetical protein [Helicobacter bilis]MDD7297344.1 hypothetical protein [Helicobacter bilis]MDY4400926.1 hypothetical protein [Helicobacter bilis]
MTRGRVGMTRIISMAGGARLLYDKCKILKIALHYATLISYIKQGSLLPPAFPCDDKS